MRKMSNSFGGKYWCNICVTPTALLCNICVFSRPQPVNGSTRLAIAIYIALMTKQILPMYVVVFNFALLFVVMTSTQIILKMLAFNFYQFLLLPIVVIVLCLGWTLFFIDNLRLL